MRHSESLLVFSNAQRGYVFMVFMTMVACSLARPWMGQSLLHPSAVPTPATTADTVKGLIQRITPSIADHFVIQVTEEADADEFTLSSNSDGRVVLAGNNGVSLASAYNHYLRRYCNSSISWNGNNVEHLPTTLPSVPTPVTRKRTTPFSYYQNVCTVSYSMVWWDWTRWQRELDWMAMNGINLPLSFTGQEYVWLQVYQKLGLSEAEIMRFFSGPAFFAWQRMGNLRTWAGPPPYSFLKAQFDLQKRILSRSLALGMVPVLPAFAGHVPQALTTLFPKSNFTRSSDWFHNTTLSEDFYLQATDPLYTRIGGMFVEQYNALFGPSSHIYNSDQFNEMRPPSSDPSYLEGAGEAQYKSLTAGDPDAVWLMQGWLFQDTGFWKLPQIKAYLGAIPDSKMIILDLFADVSPVWNRTESFFGKPYIWCELHNFGGNLGLYGNLDVVANGPTDAMKGSTMNGIGITMEGINQNYVMYQLLLDHAWSAPTPGWLSQYVAERYGSASDEAVAAWQALADTAYNCTTGQSGVTKSLVVLYPAFSMNHPGFMSTEIYYNTTQLVQAWKALFAASGAHSVAAYRYDLVDVSRQVLSNVFQVQQQKLVWGFGNKSSSDVAATIQTMKQVLADMDQVLATDKHFLLGTWISTARSWANSTTDADLYEFNARNQVTMWGPQGNIRDYASKQWSGLVSDYYAKRWDIFFNAVLTAVKNGFQFDQEAYDTACFAFEQSWQHEVKEFPTQPTGDTIAVVTELLSKYTRSL